MGVHDFHRERMRRRFRENGLSGFADHEVLELLLYYAIPRRDTNPIAHALLDRFGSLSGVFSAPAELLEQVDGVGENTAAFLRLIPLASARARLAEAERELALDTRERIGGYLLELFSQERNEAVYEICLDRKGKLLACKRLGEGSAAAVNLDIRKLVENALLCSASSVILAHNHPSGIALPSQDDHATTQQAHQALKSIGVQLEDHIIVADGDYVSYSQSGYFSF
ncbi:DNA repair protein RadC [Oscillospiraceae bacterium 38-13]